MRTANRILTLLAILALAAPALAQVVNGDFEDQSGTGWLITLPNAAWIGELRDVGGNPGGYGYLMSSFFEPDSEGQGCFEQTFVCGDDPAATCTITVDYKHGMIDANSMAGRVTIYIDGQLMYTSPPADFQDWTTVTLTVPCGTHTIQLCLEVDAGNNGWDACFDNLTADCDDSVATEENSWGDVKLLY